MLGYFPKPFYRESANENDNLGGVVPIGNAKAQSKGDGLPKLNLLKCWRDPRHGWLDLGGKDTGNRR